MKRTQYTTSPEVASFDDDLLFVIDVGHTISVKSKTVRLAMSPEKETKSNKKIAQYDKVSRDTLQTVQ